MPMLVSKVYVLVLPTFDIFMSVSDICTHANVGYRHKHNIFQFTDIYFNLPDPQEMYKVFSKNKNLFLKLFIKWRTVEEIAC